MAGGAWVKLVTAATLAGGCADPGLALPERPGSSWQLELEPGGSANSVPRVFRGRLRHAPAAGEPWLFASELSSYYERALKRGELPSALRERALPLRYWQEDDDCVFQPLVPLEPGHDYALALAGLGALQTLRVDPQAPPPLERRFPAPGRPKRSVSVVCGMPAERAPSQLLLEPGGTPLKEDDALLAGVAPGCSVFSAELPPAAAVVAPPELAGAPLEPSPWLGRGVEASAAECERGQPLQGACVEVDDDRIYVTPQSEGQLWLLREPAPKLVIASAGARSILLRDLPPGQAVTLRGSVLSDDGRRDDFAVSLQLATPRRHVVINEVLANPLGDEASGEWIEILNDSAQRASLAGLWLEDSGGHVALPAAELEPGELALLVGPGFRGAAPDVLVPEGVRVLELTSLGARGLSNSGEALLLVGAEGVVSRFPSFSAEHPGVSWARRTPEAADDDPRGFAEHGRPGASPGAPNTFDAP